MKKLKKLFYAFIALLGITSFINAKAATDAPSTISVTRGNLIEGAPYINYQFNFATYKKFIDNSKFVYCMQVHDQFPSGTTSFHMTDFSAAENSKIAGLTYIFENGYPAKSITNDADKDYWITGLAVWMYLTPEDSIFDGFHLDTGTAGWAESDAVKEIAKLVNGAKSATLKSATLNIAKDTGKLELNNNKTHYISKFTLTGENVQNISLSVTSGPEGTFIGTADGTKVTTTAPGSVLYVYVPVASATSSATVSIKANATGSTPKAYKYTTGQSGIQDIVSIYNETSDLEKTDSFTLDPITTKIEVYKIDSSSKDQIPGAKMEVRNDKDEVVDTWVTDGKVHKIDGLGFGTYTIKEIEAPDGYKIDSDPITFTLTPENYEQSFTLKNSKKTKVTIYKIDSSTTEQIPGATLEVRDSAGNVKSTWITDGKPHVIEGLGFGTYTIVETKAPDGYELNEKIAEFILTLENYEKSINFENSKKTKIIIQKIESEGKNKLVGAILSLRDKDGLVIQEWETTEDDKVIEGLNPNQVYYLHEISAPEGYELNKEVMEIKASTSEVLSYVMVNEKVENPKTGVNEYLRITTLFIASTSILLYAISKKKLFSNFN